MLATKDSRLISLSTVSKSAGTRTLYHMILRNNKILKIKIKIKELNVRVTIRFRINTETLVSLGTIYTPTLVENMMAETSIL